MKVRSAWSFSVTAILALCLGITGCGGNSNPPRQPIAPSCTGVSITGTITDSLTRQPVAQGWIALESGTQLNTLPIDNFSPTATTTSDTNGAFSLCVPSVSGPAVLVLTALDIAGKAYPAFVSPITGAKDFGKLALGGCDLLCAFAGQQQTSTPATINGTITTAPVAETGAVFAQSTIPALDDSRNLWNIAVPSLTTTASETFATAAVTNSSAAPAGCAGTTGFCAAYSFSLPTLPPALNVDGVTTQRIGAPTYTIYAAPAAPAVCKPPFGLTASQPDGSSLLATPGAQLTATVLAFASCQ